jgi:hypothetical protein
MKKLYKVKFKPTMKVWGMLGHNGPRSLEEIINLIAEHGVEKVQYVQHADKGRGGSHRFDGKEMLALWKSVKSKTSSN